MGRPKGERSAARELRAAMMDNLTARGLTEKQYTDKVEEYMDFWARRQQLRTDIEERGVTVEDDKGRIVENRSVSLEIQTSRQMLAIFQSLGFKDLACAAKIGDGDDDDL